jgi:hypothetical protein
MHSGWGVLVAVASEANSVEVIESRHLTIVAPGTAGANQPYHFAENLEIQEAEKHLEKCARISERLAFDALREVMHELEARSYQILGAAVLLASGRALPPVAKILASHPLIHTAEGEFFRNAISKACERLKISVTGIRERELDELAKAEFGSAASRVQSTILRSGKSVGPPWTKDHKNAALAAWMILSR